MGQEGKRASLCEAWGYALVEVGLDVCRLHRFGVQSDSSAQRYDFNTGLVLLTDYHGGGWLSFTQRERFDYCSFVVQARHRELDMP